MSEITIKASDVEWNMDWRNTKDNGGALYQPDIEKIFEPEKALAYLLADEQVFLNTHWWKKEWSEEQKNLFSINVNCNDIFAWACSDAEEITYSDLEGLWWHYKLDPLFGTAVWCIKRRKQLPQPPVYRNIKEQGIWNLEIMGLEENSQNAYVQSQFAMAKNK
jgi:hypothetical protein